MRTQIRDEVAGRPGDSQEVFIPNRFDGSLCILVIGFLTGSGLSFYQNRTGPRSCFCCNCINPLRLKRLLKNSNFIQNRQFTMFVPHSRQINTTFANNHCKYYSVKPYKITNTIRTKMLYEIVTCPIPVTGSPKYFKKTGSTEVPFTTTSEDSPLERARRTARNSKTSSSSRTFTLILDLLYQSDKKQQNRDKLQRSKDSSLNLYSRNNCDFSKTQLRLLHFNRNSFISLRRIKKFARILRITAVEQTNGFSYLLNRQCSNTSQMFVPF